MVQRLILLTALEEAIIKTTVTGTVAADAMDVGTNAKAGLATFQSAVTVADVNVTGGNARC
jgi:hypothetical protein